MDLVAGAGAVIKGRIVEGGAGTVDVAVVVRGFREMMTSSSLD